MNDIERAVVALEGTDSELSDLRMIQRPTVTPGRLLMWKREIMEHTLYHEERELFARDMDAAAHALRCAAEDAEDYEAEIAGLNRLRIEDAEKMQEMREALEKIANMDYRGNRSQEMEIAFRALGGTR